MRILCLKTMTDAAPFVGFLVQVYSVQSNSEDRSLLSSFYSLSVYAPSCHASEMKTDTAHVVEFDRPLSQELCSKLYNKVLSLLYKPKGRDSHPISAYNLPLDVPPPHVQADI